MNKTNKKLLAALVALLVAGAVCWLMTGRTESPDGDLPAKKTGGVRTQATNPARSGKTGKGAMRRSGANDAAVRQPSQSGTDGPANEVSDGSGEEEEGDSGKDENEKLVDAFDSLTDKWMEPAKDKISFDDIQQFAGQFRKLPKERKDECLHRALNLVPDENVMLLAGILMDKTQDKEILETVYNDVLNRDEDVKKPILRQIFKDREHPCWVDTAWILDVTGELPKNGENDAAGR